MKVITEQFVDQQKLIYWDLIFTNILFRELHISLCHPPTMNEICPQLLSKTTKELFKQLCDINSKFFANKYINRSIFFATNQTKHCLGISLIERNNPLHNQRFDAIRHMVPYRFG